MAIAPPISYVNLTTQVYEVLLGRLVSREFEPNQQLNLAGLADELGVSRSPVHQALTRLVTEGLIAVRPRKGYVVQPITEESVTQAFDVRLAFELVAAEKTVGKIAQSDLEEFRRRMEATLPLVQDDRIVDRPGYVRANQAMHAFQIGLAGNRLMERYFEQLSLHLIMGRVAGKRPSGMGHIIREHQALIAAFEAGDLAAAQAAIRRHIQSGKQVAAEEIRAAGGVL